MGKLKIFGGGNSDLFIFTSPPVGAKKMLADDR